MAKKTQTIMERFLRNEAKCVDGEQGDQVPSVRVDETSGASDMCDEQASDEGQGCGQTDRVDGEISDDAGVKVVRRGCMKKSMLVRRGGMKKSMLGGS